MTSPEIRLEGIHCNIVIEELAPTVVRVTIDGTDAGDFGDAPFRALAPILERHSPVELFIDARRARGPSIDVSNDWAQWLSSVRDRLRHVSMLTRSPFVHLTADFVRRFADLGDLMRIYTEPAFFEGALGHALANARTSLAGQRGRT